MQAVITEIKRNEEALPSVREAGVEALHRLLQVAQGVTGQSGVAARFLLGLYNGPDFKFDLTDLRYMDSKLVEDCLALLRMDSNPEQEVHQYIENGQEIWQQLRRNWISDEGQLFAEIKKSSKYAHQADWCRNGPCGDHCRGNHVAEAAFGERGGHGTGSDRGCLHRVSARVQRPG